MHLSDWRASSNARHKSAGSELAKMRNVESQRGRLLSVESIAGWVFADLLLVLFLVGLGTGIARDEEPPIVGMSPDSINLNINFDAARLATSDPEKQKVCESIRNESLGRLDGKRAALVLVFSGGKNPAAGVDSSSRIRSQLSCANDEVFRKDLVFRDYWDGSLPSGAARLEVFVYLTAGS